VLECRAVSPSTASSARPWALGALVFATIYWIVVLVVLRAGTPDVLDDTWEYAVVARHLLHGHGFVTSVIHPPLWGLHDAALRVPVLVHGPLIPALLAPAIALFGPAAADQVAWLAAAFAVLAAWLAYRLGARLAAPPVGAAAAGLFTLSPLTLEAVNHDLALLIGAALLLAALELVTRPRPAPFAAGLALGLAYLVRPEMLVAAPVVAAFEWRRLAPFAAGFLACALPWWGHHALAVGSPWFNLSNYLLLGYWGAHPDMTVLRDFRLTPAAWPQALFEARGTLLPKWIEFFPHAMKRALMVPTDATGWLALTGLAAAGARRTTRGFALRVLLLTCIPVAVMTTTTYSTRYLVPFLPLWALGAALGACTLAQVLPPWGRRPRAWIGLLVLMALPSVGPALREAPRAGREHRERLARDRAGLDALAGRERGLLFSDTPDHAAWITGRPTVWVTRREYDRLPACAGSGAGMNPGAGAGAGKEAGAGAAASAMPGAKPGAGAGAAASAMPGASPGAGAGAMKGAGARVDSGATPGASPGAGPTDAAGVPLPCRAEGQETWFHS